MYFFTTIIIIQITLTDIFKIWQGGMSFHGGLIGVIIASIWFAKKNDQ